MTDHAELRRLAAGANLPPVRVIKCGNGCEDRGMQHYVTATPADWQPSPLAGYADTGIWSSRGLTTEPIARYIAAACNAVPKLLDERDRLRKLLRRARAAIDPHGNSADVRDAIAAALKGTDDGDG